MPRKGKLFMALLLFVASASYADDHRFWFTITAAASPYTAPPLCFSGVGRVNEGVTRH